MPVDLTKLKPGVKVTLSDGVIHEVRGCFMSTDGMMVTVKVKPGSIVDRNVSVNDIIQVEE